MSEPTLIETPDLLAGARTLSIVSGDGRWRSTFLQRIHELGMRSAAWVIYEVNGERRPGFPGTVTLHDLEVTRYPDAPGMDAKVALRRFLAERERERIGTCDLCDQPIYNDQKFHSASFPIAGERDAGVMEYHADCEEANDGRS